MSSNQFDPRAFQGALLDAPRPTSSALLDRATADTVQLLRRFENLLALAPMKSNDQNLAATETYQFEVETAALVRAAEDLLSLNRSLKEMWLFGSLDVIRDGEKGGEKEDLERMVAEVGKVVQREVKELSS